MNVYAPSETKYIRGVMDILFTVDEMKKGKIFLVNRTVASKTNRRKLDADKSEFLKKAYMIKYKISKENIAMIWKKVVEKANRKCFDLSKPVASANNDSDDN